MAHPAPIRSFAVTHPSTGDVVYPEFAYPLRKEIIPIWAAALLASLVPITVILHSVVHLLEPLSIIPSLTDTISRRISSKRDIRLAHIQKVRAQSANKPLDEDLEDGGGDERGQGLSEAAKEERG